MTDLTPEQFRRGMHDIPGLSDWGMTSDEIDEAANELLKFAGFDPKVENND